MKIKDNPNSGHRKRLRDRFEKNGSLALAEHELLELLLTYSIPLKDVKPLAKTLLSHFGSLSKVLNSEISEIRKINGIGASSAILINLVKDLNTECLAEKMIKSEVLSSPENVIKFVKSELAGKRDENFMVIYLDTKNYVIDFEISSKGTVDQAAVYPRKIIRRALDCNAAGLILAHNHPSGEPDPSDEDIKLTKSFEKVCSVMNIRLLDHIIVGAQGYVSFNKESLLK